MSEQNDFFDDFIGDEIDADGEEIEDDETSVEIRSVLMAKNDMLALLGLKTSTAGGLIVRVDPRQAAPTVQNYDDAASARAWFNRSLATSKKNGWTALYDGEPSFG